MTKRLSLPAAIGLLLAVLPVSSQTLRVPKVEDAYHFRYWAGMGHAADYTEWWYFNVYDSVSHLQAIFTYLVTNPANILGAGTLGFAFGSRPMSRNETRNVTSIRPSIRVNS